MKHFKGAYSVDENGYVYSAKYGSLRKLKPRVNNHGYIMYRLSIDGKVSDYSAHSLSYYVNISPFDSSDGLQIDHIDGNKLNNHYSNLRRVTRLENMRNPITKQWATDRLVGNNYAYKCDIDLSKLRALRLKGETISGMAREFNCSRSTIRNYLKNNNLY